MLGKKTIFIFFCLIRIAAFSQTVEIRGYANDSLSGMPLQGVDVIVNDDDRKAVSDEYGYFSLKVNSLPCKLQLRHISYKVKNIQVAKNQNTFHFVMVSQPVDLDVVEISTNIPVQVMPEKHYHIMDYEFYSDNIVVLAFENQSFLNPVLLLVNFDGDTLSRLEISKPVKLSKDYTGKIYLCTKTTAWAVNIDSSKLSVSDPVNIDEFNSVNNIITAKSGTNYYLKKSFYNNQELDYYHYEEVKDSLRRFKTIIDIDKIKRNQKGYYFDGKEEDIRFQQLIILRPVYAPMICLKDTVMIFDFIASRLEKYNIAAQPAGEIDIGFQQEKSFADELLVDETVSKVYFLFKKNGMSTLKQLDLQSGRMVNTIPIPNFIFVEKIRVRDNKVYFLYKDKYNEEYKKLYKFKI
jgi:hypothetical protein